MGPIPSASTTARVESFNMVIADPFNSKSGTTPLVGAAAEWSYFAASKRCRRVENFPRARWKFRNVHRT